MDLLFTMLVPFLMLAVALWGLVKGGGGVAQPQQVGGQVSAHRVHHPFVPGKVRVQPPDGGPVLRLYYNTTYNFVNQKIGENP